MSDVVKELLFPKDVEISIGLSFLKRKLSAYIRLNKFDTFAEVMAVASQVGANTFIDLGVGNTITLNNVNMDDLTPDDFVFDEGMVI